MNRLLAIALGPALVALASSAPAQTFRDQAVSIEIADLDGEAERDARREVERILIRLENELDALAGELDRDQTATLTAEMRRLLERALQFCHWSQGAVGPAGGEVYRLWEEEDYPIEERVEEAAQAADCGALLLGPESAAMDSDAGLDLRRFDLGFAVDRAVEILQQAGVGNGLVRVGPVVKGFGPGPRGEGWSVELPRIPGQTEPLAPVMLQGRALSFALAHDGELRLDLRSGRPTGDGLLAVLVMTELGVDAQALAEALFALGTREGDFRAGALRPAPSILWLMGSGSGAPLISVRRWGELHAH
jgi:thiamine biosynthesis lipoprotein ApbE